MSKWFIKDSWYYKHFADDMPYVHKEDNQEVVKRLYDHAMQLEDRRRELEAEKRMYQRETRQLNRKLKAVINKHREK